MRPTDSSMRFTVAVTGQLLCWLLVLPSATGAAQGIDVDSADLALRGGRLASGAWGCGFSILANHRTRDDPHLEWDVNVDQVNNGTQIAVSVTAASFTVAHKARGVRAPATEVTFMIDQDPLPVRIHMATAADSQGAVRGELGTDDADRLFAAVGAGSFITLTLEATGREDESLRFHFARDSAGPAQGAFAELCRPATAAPR